MKSSLKKLRKKYQSLKVLLIMSLGLAKDIQISNLLGTYYVPFDSHDDLVISFMKRGQIFDEAVINCIMDQYTPGDILDIGANFGQMSVQLGRFIEKYNLTNTTDYCVYSFEANPIVFKYLKKNLELNVPGVCIPKFGAIWDKNGETAFFPYYSRNQEVTYGTYCINFHDEGQPVTTITIDSMNFERRISIIKTDVQGADLRALKGAINTINIHKPVIITEYETRFAKLFNEHYQDYIDFLDTIDYVLLNESPPDLSNPNVSIDLIAIPRDRRLSLQ